eukprot:3356082-Prymnesium_polylepis.1
MHAWHRDLTTRERRARADAPQARVTSTWPRTTSRRAPFCRHLTPRLARWPRDGAGARQVSSYSDVREDIYVQSTETDPSDVRDRYDSVGGVELHALELRHRDLEAEIDAAADAECKAREQQRERLRRMRSTNSRAIDHLEALVGLDLDGDGDVGMAGSDNQVAGAEPTVESGEPRTGQMRGRAAVLLQQHLEEAEERRAARTAAKRPHDAAARAHLRRGGEPSFGAVCDNRSRKRAGDGERTATRVFDNVVVYTPRDKSGGREDHIPEYPITETRLPSLAQSAREAEQAWNAHVQQHSGQMALDALERLTGLDLDGDGDIGVKGHDNKNKHDGEEGLLGSGFGRSDDPHYC